MTGLDNTITSRFILQKHSLTMGFLFYINIIISNLLIIFIIIITFFLKKKKINYNTNVDHQIIYLMHNSIKVINYQKKCIYIYFLNKFYIN